MKEWFSEIDVLKTTAILLIVFSHMDNYVSYYDLIRLVDNHYVSWIGLSIFFFISGFLLSQTDSIITSIKDIKKFYMKKFIRIFPLYWVALVSFILIFGLLEINPGHVIPYNFDLNNLLVHFFGLQGIFPDYVISPLWFVGVIILFYLSYPVIVYFSKNFFDLFVVSSIILILFLILHFFYGLFDVRALQYYPIFISGIFINKIAYSSKKFVDEPLLKRILILNIFLIFMIFLVLVLRKFYEVNLQFFPYIIEIVAVIPLCIFYLIFARLFIKIREKLMLIISSISFGTYAIYLFHLQFLAFFSLIIDVIVLNIILQDIIILTFGFTGAILCGIIIQQIERYFFLRYKNRILSG
jgi:peptidoglycan/LPS O-acetylase OafA/YrhL